MSKTIYKAIKGLNPELSGKWTVVNKESWIRNTIITVGGTALTAGLGELASILEGLTFTESSPVLLLLTPVVISLIKAVHEFLRNR